MTTQIPETVDLSKYVETRLMGDRPHVRGRRMPVAWVASAARANGYDIPDLMDSYTLTEELDVQETRCQQEWEELYELQGGDMFPSCEST